MTSLCTPLSAEVPVEAALFVKGHLCPLAELGDRKDICHYQRLAMKTFQIRNAMRLWDARSDITEAGKLPSCLKMPCKDLSQSLIFEATGAKLAGHHIFS